MSNITKKFFNKLHSGLMENADYRNGYEYAKNHRLWNTLTLDELIVAGKVYATMGFDGNRQAVGMAFAIREIIWGRIQEEKVSA